MSGMLNKTLLQPFTPLNIADCSLWLDASQGITVDGYGNVSAWADQSGSGHDVSQSTVADRPAFVSNVTNGRPVVRFNAVSSHCLTVAGFTAANDLTAFAVYTYDDNGAMHCIVDRAGINDYILVVRADQKVGLDGTASYVASPTAMTDDVPGILTWRYTLSPNEAHASLNGESENTNTGGTSRDSWDQIGRFGGSSYPCNGDLAELIMYDRNLSSLEIDQVEAYLSSKYGIGLVA